MEPFADLLPMRENTADVTVVTGDPKRFGRGESPGSVRRALARARRVILVVGLAGIAGCSLTPDLDPTPPDPSASTKILASDGSLLATLDLGEHREPVAIDRIAATLQDAVESQQVLLRPQPSGAPTALLAQVHAVVGTAPVLE